MSPSGDTLDFLQEVNIDRQEGPDDSLLARKLAALWSFRPEFIAIIGYTFARQNDNIYNDWVSFREFARRFRFSRGNIFVIDPVPYPLCELLHRELPLATIVPVPVMWNL